MLDRYLNSSPEVPERLAFPRPLRQIKYANGSKTKKGDMKDSKKEESKKAGSDRKATGKG